VAYEFAKKTGWHLMASNPFVFGMPDPVKPSAVTSVYGAMRFALEPFSLHILLAKLGTHGSMDRFLTVFLAILLGALIVSWSLGLSTVM
jgi:hypothetical protein